MARPRTVFGWLMAGTLPLAAVLAVTGGLLATVHQPATGSLLPWEAKLLDGDSAVFVVDGVEVGAGTMRRWFVLHAVLLSALWAVLYVVTARSAREDRR